MGNCLKREIGIEEESEGSKISDFDEIIKKIRIMKSKTLFLNHNKQFSRDFKFDEENENNHPEIQILENKEDNKNIPMLSNISIENLDNTNNMAISMIIPCRSISDTGDSILFELSKEEIYS